MKAILASIQPRWCELIAAGAKTYEIRKNAIPIGSKVYIYQTQKKWEFSLKPELANKQGKVIAEFICDDVIESMMDEYHDYDIDDDVVSNSQVDRQAINNYGNGKKLYFWHISDLELYADAKTLDAFERYSDSNDRPCEKGLYCEHEYFDYAEDCKACAIDFDGTNCPRMKLQKPPQSWCYIDA